MATGEASPRTLGDALGALRASTAAAFVGLLLLAIGSLGPWITTVVGSASGTRGDGVITLALAGGAALLLATVGRYRVAVILAGAAALAALSVAGYDLIHIEHETARVSVLGARIADAGWGVYIAVGGAAIAAGALATRLPRIARPVSALVAVAAVGAIGVAIALSAQTPASRRAVARPRPSAARTQVPPAAITAPGNCGGSVNAGPNTSCPFAQAVFQAVSSAYAQSASVPDQVRAYSPTTGKTYTMTRVGSADGKTLTCTGGIGARVSFPIGSLG